MSEPCKDKDFRQEQIGFQMLCDVPNLESYLHHLVWNINCVKIHTQMYKGRFECRRN